MKTAMNSVRQQLSVARRAKNITASRLATTSASPKVNELAQRASQLVNQFGSKLPELTGSLGGRFNGLLGSYGGPFSYYFAVTKEVLKQVYIKENLAPPKLEQIKSSYQMLLQNAQSLNYWKQIISNGEWKRLTIYGLEAAGIFSIGEMIGRRHIVGYKLD
ncbi:mitochondrial ATP synthase g subunit-domain-containing protein [Phakopsora pachyrhizi]|uniref:Mitochondrial ATP synthase g subunit-domain-containing protein n=1 Tax=Phakopsora pachyrhizi TaxID=170000 RepID=A0AAV0AP79_PHAPC|nr:mitochondrial ATP synthase g subunit-domain-containing protein [Phakopsora pachyrhizi]CAH7669123.1 mitochondrial ATP synthase g subunit-domain-containing protein [Phakopsora pachyrhizi]